MSTTTADFLEETRGASLSRRAGAWLAYDVARARDWIHRAHAEQFPVIQPTLHVAPGLLDIESRASEIFKVAQRELTAQGILDLGTLKRTELDDGGVLIEFVMRKARLGFSIELDEGESGWYFVSDESAGAVLASGSIRGMRVQALVDLARGCTG